MDGGLGLRKEFEEVFLKSNYFDRNEKWLMMMVMGMLMMICNDDFDDGNDNFDDDDW